MKSNISFLFILVSFSLSAQNKIPPNLFLQNSFSALKIDSNIIYRRAVDLTGDTVTLHLSIYYPVENINFKKPLLILLPPGGFYSSKITNENMTGLAYTFSGYGYVVAVVEYRTGIETLQTISFENAIYKATQDANVAVKFLKTIAPVYCIDTSTIFIGGTSAGAFVAIHTAYLNQTEVNDSIDISSEGLLDDGNIFPGVSSKTTAVLNISGGILDKKIMENETEPIISFHSTFDSTVYFHSGLYKHSVMIYGSYIIDSLAVANNMVHELKPFIKTGHGYNFNTPYMDTTIKMASAFLYSFISSKNGTDLCNTNFNFTLYPVPSLTHLYIKNQNAFLISNSTFEIFDMLGTKIRKELLSTIGINESAELNISHLPQGSYILRLSEGNNQQVYRFIIQ